MKRLFEMGEYENWFSQNRATKTYEYKGYVIYEYLNDIGNVYDFTFWTSSIDSDYYSSIKDLETAKQLIQRIISSNIL